ncbi:MAG: hypothetical protein GXO40_01835 [Epsilonproteobacteria bacterium]|nr:hypothetical protein [Campylobacterota bacterium]
MFRTDNFIYFLSVSGFFVGLVFAILHDLEPLEFLATTIGIFVLFYMIAIASTGFFIKFLSIKNIFELDKEYLEKTIDYQINELDKKEDMILDAYYFIKKLEEEELDVYKKKDKE